MKTIKIRKLPKRSVGPKIVRNEEAPKKGDLGELNAGWPKSLVAEKQKRGLL
jgi:hypothetical protein